MFGSASVAFMENGEILWSRKPWKWASQKFFRYAEEHDVAIVELLNICSREIKLYVVFDDGSAAVYSGNWKKVIGQIPKKTVDHIQMIDE